MYMFYFDNLNSDYCYQFLIKFLTNVGHHTSFSICFWGEGYSGGLYFDLWTAKFSPIFHTCKSSFNLSFLKFSFSRLYVFFYFVCFLTEPQMIYLFTTGNLLIISIISIIGFFYTCKYVLRTNFYHFLIFTQCYCFACRISIKPPLSHVHREILCILELTVSKFCL